MLGSDRCELYDTFGRCEARLMSPQSAHRGQF